MSKQAYGILAKIREVDQYLALNKGVLPRIAEVHPELSFAAWNGGLAMSYSKKTKNGKSDRRLLIDDVWPSQADRLRLGLRGADYRADDLYDAFAALWSVRRWTAKQAECVGDVQARDEKGLPMRMIV